MAKAPPITDDDDDAASITLPILPHGYRTELCHWPELQALVASNDLSRLSRSAAQQRTYEVHLRKLRRTWKSVTDHILCTKLDMTRKQDDVTGLFFCCRSDDGDDSEKAPRTVVVRNDFPYYIPDTIEHWVLWKLGGRCSDADIASSKDEIQQKGGKRGVCYVDFLHWINPPELQSLPDIDHVHILCLKGESVSQRQSGVRQRPGSTKTTL